MSLSIATANKRRRSSNPESETSSAVSSTSSFQVLRPRFDSKVTSDRLREASSYSPSPLSGNIKKGRVSAFKELGLDDDFVDSEEDIFGAGGSGSRYRFDRDGDGGSRSRRSSSHDIDVDRSTNLQINCTAAVAASEEKEEALRRSPSGEAGREGKEEVRGGRGEDDGGAETPTSPSGRSAWLSKLGGKLKRPNIRTTSSAPPPTMASFSRIAMIALLITILYPSYGQNRAVSSSRSPYPEEGMETEQSRMMLHGRADSPTQVCKRWSQQTALLNGTLYIYGGQASTSQEQTTDTWNNDFLTLDLTKSWSTSAPLLAGLPQPSGPPKVANGYLWNDYNSLFLYGGEFADNPYVDPDPIATWQYDVSSSSWNEYSAPVTSEGTYSDAGGAPVQRSAEGAGLSVPELGRSWYFGGHLDWATTPGWSNQIDRVYLKSMLEFTHPGYANAAVYSIQNSGAAAGGVYRNITQGGMQSGSNFTERADGVLVFVPGWGDDGILLGLAGGTNDTFTEMNTIDVYDISSSIWYKQSTIGAPPPVRVNPCAVVASAPDASSFNVYLYGGQNLIPAGDQTQYSDMWILTIPSFTWIQVNLDGQSQPAARAGHTCNMWDGQIVVVGGYTGADSTCDSGFYVFNASSLQWVNSFTPIDGGTTEDPGNSVLSGSNGYEVPPAVQSVVGGGTTGGATVSTPAAGSATAGPFATGKPPIFTVTEAGATVTQTQPGSVFTATGSARTTTGTATSPSGSSASSTGTPSSSTSSDSKSRTSAIAVGSVAGVLALVAAYLAFCAYLHRKQIAVYKKHAGGGFMRRAMREKKRPRRRIGPFGTEIHPTGMESSDFDFNHYNNDRMSWGEISDDSANGTHGNGSNGHNNNFMTTVLSSNSGDASALAGSAGYRDRERERPLPAPGFSGSNPHSQEHSQSPSGHDRSSTENHTPLERSYSSTYRWNDYRQTNSTANSSVEDLLGNHEPNFFNVVLAPRQALRVINRD